ncbi:hypothetical protein ACVSKW_02960, partial [Pseudomonas aeruginosa]
REVPISDPTTHLHTARKIQHLRHTFVILKSYPSPRKTLPPISLQFCFRRQQLSNLLVGISAQPSCLLATKITVSAATAQSAQTPEYKMAWKLTSTL